VNIVEAAYQAAFPSVDELWQRGGADVKDGIPYFPLEDVKKPEVLSEKDLYQRKGWTSKKIGSALLLRYDTSDGIDRLVSIRRLDDQYRSEADLTVASSTAWTTTVNGYAGRRDRRIAQETGLQTITIGAEGSTNQRYLDSDVRAAISLAKTAQSEQAILADASTRFDLSRNQYGIGDSRGAMIKPGHTLYAPMYGNNVLFTDIKAPCVPDKLEPKDLPKVVAWLGMEAVGAASVGVSLARDTDLALLLGTFDADPRALHTALFGTMQALMSGEAGKLAELAPDDMHGHVVLYGHDILSSAERWNDIYAPKPDMFIKNVPRGSHAHLLGKISLQIDRIRRAEELVATNQSFDDRYVIRGVRAATKKQADLQLVVNQ
jgi:hypothetical protein